ncbi:hypothetical protein ACEZDB_12115 [Streptacidiphilus sp. N1-3]|uniref:Uncharacterized protein n=1 Tax=Streptacidiphilus alkalitolerans TaxID=3342712 RepID=A0ABV6WZB8_9ACTN
MPRQPRFGFGKRSPGTPEATYEQPGAGRSDLLVNTRTNELSPETINHFIAAIKAFGSPLANRSSTEDPGAWAGPTPPDALSINFDGHTVSIRKDGFGPHMKGVQTIPVAQIEHAIVKAATSMVHG